MSQVNRVVPGIASRIVDDIEGRIATGALGPGNRLPTIRVLATELGVARATVSAAYRDLGRRGAIVSRGRAGTFVAPRPPLGPPPGPPAVPVGVADLASGNPDPALLPTLTRTAPSTPVLYGDDQILPAMAEAASSWLDANGVPEAPLAVVGGAMDGVERILQARLRPGDAIGVEDPGYPNVVDVARALGLQTKPIPIDRAGMLPTALDAVASSVEAVVLTPRAHNPTGAATSKTRARELRDVLGAHRHLLVIEDDHSTDVAGAPLHLAVPAAVRWATIHSFAKSLGPDIRVAVVTGDEDTIARVRGRQRLGTGWVSHELQRIVAEALTDPRTQRALTTARETYARRRALLVDAVERYGLLVAADSGFNIWVPVPDEAAAVSHLLVRGFAVQSGARYVHHQQPAVRVTISTLASTDAETVAAAIADLATTHSGRTSTA